MSILKKLLLFYFILISPLLSNELPDLGEYSDSFLSDYQESLIAREILYQIHNSPDVVEDEEINDYLGYLGNRLVAHSDNPERRFNFFVVKDPSINAFAMLGGLIGVHTGLLISASNESEIASVLSHEIAHVTQNHLQRVIAKQNRDQYKSLLLLAVGLLAARSNPQLASGAMISSQAINVQNFLNYTREHEQEADNEGVKILYKAGYNVGSSIDFFQVLQKGSRFSTAAPSYLRTHPITTDRINSISNRIKDYPYRYFDEKSNFHFVRAKTRALYDKDASEKVFEQNIKNQTYLNKEAELYALVCILVKQNKIDAAKTFFQQIKNIKNPFIDTLNIDILIQEKKYEEARGILERKLKDYSNYRSFVYRLSDIYIKLNLNEKAKELLKLYLKKYVGDPSLYRLSAMVYKNENQDLLYHENMGEYYYYKYDLKEAINQFGMAVKVKSDNDFYRKSRVEARLKQLQTESQFLNEQRK
ncbi:MAG: M48 family metalloprotease [Nitrosomonadales bacterium]